MAFDIESHTSTRLNHIQVGQRVTLCDTQKKKAIASAVLIGWYGPSGEMKAPTTMKSMEDGVTMRFGDVLALDGTPLANIELVRAPDTFGAMFVAEQVGEGDKAKTVYRRVTAYEHEDDVAARKQAAIDALEAKRTKSAEEAVTVEETV